MRKVFLVDLAQSEMAAVLSNRYNLELTNPQI